MIVPPGFSLPLRSASSTIFTAMRSLMGAQVEGLDLGVDVGGYGSLVILLIRTSGVSPITSRMLAAALFRLGMFTGWPRRGKIPASGPRQPLRSLCGRELPLISPGNLQPEAPTRPASSA